MVSLKQLLGAELKAADGVAGRISDFSIDEKTWTVGYAVVPVGGILSGEHQSVPVTELIIDGENHLLESPHNLPELAALSSTHLGAATEEGWAAVRDETPQGPTGVSPAPRSLWCSFNAMLNCDVSASDGVYGSLDDLLVALEQWRVQYFVGRSYAWKKKSSVLIPTRWVDQVSWKGETVEVSASREALEREPSYKPTSHTQTQ